MKVIEVNHSIANRFKDHIEINKNLKKYPKLYKPILKHEFDHTDKVWSFYDFKLDMISNTGVNYWDLIKFMIKHPRSFLQLSPLIYSKKMGWIFDINLFIIYFVFVLTFMTTIYIGVNYL
ncbi:hypothetical protein LCGC14_0652060 [marine sediment metagenome]|uniref:Uncharacterized protein n=1 Tax=marine sediment metagenome TaxID=412755 RepID=A0A0F9U4E8_9ZZZZ